MKETVKTYIGLSVHLDYFSLSFDTLTYYIHYIDERQTYTRLVFRLYSILKESGTFCFRVILNKIPIQCSRLQFIN